MLVKYFILVVILAPHVLTLGNNPNHEAIYENSWAQNSVNKRTGQPEDSSQNSSRENHEALETPKFWIRDNSDFASRNYNRKFVDERDKEFLAAVHEDLYDEGHSNEQKSGQSSQEWETARLVLHHPRANSVTIAVGGRELELEMVDSSGIVAPGAKLYRSPDAEPVPLLVRSACHYSLYRGTARTGSLSVCHPLGTHAILMVDGELIDIVPREVIDQSPTILSREQFPYTSSFEQHSTPTLTARPSPRISPPPQIPSPSHQTLSPQQQLSSQPQQPSSPSISPERDFHGNGVYSLHFPTGHSSHVLPALEDKYAPDLNYKTESNMPVTYEREEISLSNIDGLDSMKFSEKMARLESEQSDTVEGMSVRSRNGKMSVQEDPAKLGVAWGGHLAKTITKAVPGSNGSDGASVTTSDALLGTDFIKHRTDRGNFRKIRKRRHLPPQPRSQQQFPTFSESSNEILSSNFTDNDSEFFANKRFYSPYQKRKLTLEVALFLDAVLLDNLFSFYTEDQLINLILSLMNNVQSFFHQETLGRRLDLSITQLYLLRTQPSDLPTYEGDRLKLLESFCAYQKVRAHPSDSSPLNWDLAVYLSGLDLTTKLENGGVSDVTMGLTYTGGVCDLQRSCIISEFSTTNAYGRPFPSAGALTSLILTHEIGHSLGLRHDGSNNTCTGQNNIMAPGRGPRGGTTWSRCSREAFAQQNGRCLWDSGKASVWDEAGRGVLPGQRFDAVSQCQLFFRDHDATLTWPSNLKKLCNSVQCSSPHRLTSYLAGPALEGTYCGASNWCRGGKCVPWTDVDNVTVTVGGLGQWEEGPCTSACLAGGTGWRESRRPCNSPAPQNSDKGCITTSYKTDFCDDKQVCGSRRRNMTVALAELCERVSERYPDVKSEGEQQKHDPTEPWLACVLYCRLHSNASQLWTPRYLFQDDPTVPTHLPPGAPCHTDPDGTIYRCYHRTCVPHTERFTVAVSRDMAGLFEYRDPPSLDDLVIKAGPPVNDPLGDEDYPEFDLDDLY